jgi:hypothetical protein
MLAMRHNLLGRDWDLLILVLSSELRARLRGSPFERSALAATASWMCHLWFVASLGRRGWLARGGRPFLDPCDCCSDLRGFELVVRISGLFDE